MAVRRRTAASLLLTVILAEQVLGLVPPGTHHWYMY
jgi:2-polyprenyl-3-methyl-5-hydroxy-6-metoxy-1,4-benzoquinol methylase